MYKTWVRFLGREDPLKKEMAIHSSTLAWKIPWTEEADRLQSVGLQSLLTREPHRVQLGITFKNKPQLQKEGEGWCLKKGREKKERKERTCPTLTVAYQAPPSMGFSRQECWSGLPIPFPGDLPDSGIKLGSPALQADALPSEPPGKHDMEH